MADPDKHPCPAPLRFSRMMGEHHLLINGGVLDQPLMLQAVRYAGYLDDLIKTRMPSKDFKVRDDAESKLVDEIIELQRELLSKRA